MNVFEQFLANAADYAAYYMPSRSIFEKIFKLQHPSASQDDVRNYLNEESTRVFQAPVVIDDYFADNAFNLSSLAQKAQIVSLESTEIVDFEKIFEGVTQNDDDNLQPYIKLKESYENFLMDQKEPQLPEYFFGLLKCLNLEDVNLWTISEDEESSREEEGEEDSARNKIRSIFKSGIEAKYQDEESNFSECMMPFNPFKIDWDTY